MAEDESESFLEKMNLKRLPSVLGEQSFVRKIKDKFFESKRHIEVPESKRLAPSAERIINGVCEHYGMDAAQLLLAKRGTNNEARSIWRFICFGHLRGSR